MLSHARDRISDPRVSFVAADAAGLPEHPGGFDRVVAAFREAGLRSVAVEGIEIPTRFESFSDYWRPFLGGTGPAPTYVTGLAPQARAALRDRLERRLAPSPESPIDLVAGSWAVRGIVG